MCRTLSEPKLLVFSCTEFGYLVIWLILDISVFMSTLNFKLSRAENEKKSLITSGPGFRVQSPKAMTSFQNAKAMTRSQVQYPTKSIFIL